MQFSWLEGVSKKWRGILVIGRTIERDGKRYHIVGMTMEEAATLYILEPSEERKKRDPKKKRTQRMILREQETESYSYMQCREFKIGSRKMCTQSACAGDLIPENYEEIKLFLDMMDAGWQVPAWLRETDWRLLRLVKLTFADVRRLPGYSPDMPITIRHDPAPRKHLLARAKPLTLGVGKPMSFRFTAHDGSKVQCHINQVTLVDVWAEAKKSFGDEKLRKRFTAEQLREMENSYYQALRQSCPEGMCYVGIEYECSKDISLQFYEKAFLDSYPESRSGSATFFVMSVKPDKKTGSHGLALRGTGIAVPVPPDTTAVSVELLFYMERTEAWEEVIDG